MEILIAGGGIAGPAVAFLLSRIGHSCTIVERADDFRSSGQQIDVSGEGLKVVKRMCIDQAIWNARVVDDGLKFVDDADNIVASFPVGDDISSPSIVREYEILRPDLASIVYERTKPEVKYIFGEHIVSLDQDDDGVTVQFAKSGSERRFDMLIIADGLRSRTRDLAFGTSNTEIARLRMYAGFFSVPWQESDGTWSRWHNASGGRCITMYASSYPNGTLTY